MKEKLSLPPIEEPTVQWSTPLFLSHMTQALYQENEASIDVFDHKCI